MKKLRSGFTLIELVLTIALLGLVIQVIYSVFFIGNKSYSVSTNKGFSQQDVRIVGNVTTSGLEYITDLSTSDDYFGEYYSMRIDTVDGKKVFTKTFHKYTGDGTEASKDSATTKKIVTSIKGNWKSFSIINNSAGKIDVLISQEEGRKGQESGYELPLRIITSNNMNLMNNINIDLIEGDILYYRNYLPSLLTNGIELKGPSAAGKKTITFNFNNGNANQTYTAEIGNPIIFPPNPTKVDNLFNGWNPDIKIIPGMDLTLNAVWKTSSEDTKINYYDGDKLFKSDSAKPNTETSISSAPPGGSFNNWNTDKEGKGTSYYPESQFNVPLTDINLYAVWNTGYLKGLEIVKVGNTLDGSITITDGYYKVGNNNKIFIKLKFEYNNNSDRLKVEAAGFTGSIKDENNDLKTITLEGAGIKNNDGIVEVMITVSEKSNPAIMTTTKVKLSGK